MHDEELHSIYVVSYKTMLKANQHFNFTGLHSRTNVWSVLVCFQHSFMWNYNYFKKHEKVMLPSSFTTFMTHIHKFIYFIWLFSKNLFLVRLQHAVFHRFLLKLSASSLDTGTHTAHWSWALELELWNYKCVSRSWLFWTYAVF